MSPRAPLLLTAGLAACLAAGCYSLPDRVRADFAPPDGSRPNNFGLQAEGGEVHPDTPTIPASPAPESASATQKEVRRS